MTIAVAVYALIQIGLTWLVIRSRRGIVTKLVGLGFVVAAPPLIILVLAGLRRDTGFSDLIAAMAVALLAVGLLSIAIGWLVALAERWWARK
ncbi:hypothetical protein BH10PSE12_BH10PSE12_11380 [soil metagenome]